MLGLPMVAPNIGGIGEFIDETTGWLVPGADSVDDYVSALNEIRDFPTEARAALRPRNSDSSLIIHGPISATAWRRYLVI